MSALTGIAIYVVLDIFSVQYGVLWAVLAFLLNYIPNIGSVLASIPPGLFKLCCSPVFRWYCGNDCCHRNQYVGGEYFRTKNDGKNTRTFYISRHIAFLGGCSVLWECYFLFLLLWH